ncbi:ion transporter [bacterium]|nr:ion transporter [bacterium]
MKNTIKNFLDNKFVEYSLMFLIFLNLIAFILQTDVNINNKFNYFFNIFEIFSVAVFTVEYFLRLIIINKFKEIFSTYMLIDLAAILPFYLSFITVNTIFLRALRLFRLFRIAKITRYSHAFNNIKQAFIKRKNELVVTLFIFASAVLISSISIYFAENQTGNEAFSSVITSFWWSIVTFTTVGYGDTYPITTAGKIIGCLTAIFGVGLHGILIGVISSALMDVIKNSNSE